MTIEAALVAKLADVIGHARIFRGAIPDTNINANQWPCLVYMHVGDNEQFGLNETTAPGDHEDMFSLTLWGPKGTDLTAARDTLKNAFTGVGCQGVWGGSGGVVVAGAQARDASATLNPANDGSDDHMHAESVMLKIFWYS